MNFGYQPNAVYGAPYGYGAYPTNNCGVGIVAIVLVVFLLLIICCCCCGGIGCFNRCGNTM
ncbi:unknown [Firmicutes bacterium CAG:631]|nr:unknown [Firmicutes bacterium CAG:631]